MTDEPPGPWTCPAHGCKRPLEEHPVERASRILAAHPQPEPTKEKKR